MKLCASIGHDKAMLHIEDLVAEGAAQRLVDLALRHLQTDAL
jgi:hypothetical protein